MLNLASVSDILSIVTASAVTGIDVHVSWADLNGTTVTPGRTNTPQITLATTTTIVAAPAASTIRNVKALSIRNTHASTSQTITIRHFDGTTTTTLISIVLLAGYSLTYADGDGWELIDTTGARITGTLPGRWLRSTLLTLAASTHTVGADCRSIILRGVGGGGGGAGCTSVATAASAGGGGGAGGFLEKNVGVTPSTAYSYTCGAAGAGASGALGGNGGNSTFVVGATTYTAPGGTGAPVATAVTTLSAYRGGLGATVSTNGDINVGGDPGTMGVVVVVATPLGVSGNGGCSPLGAGGAGISAVGNGNNATGYGAGGGGALTGASVVRTGGNGTAGCWVVDEYS